MTIEEYSNYNDMQRTLIVRTGRAGAIMFELEAWKEAFPNATDEEISAHSDFLHRQIKRQGTYTVSERGVEYEGLFDKYQPDGVVIIKENGYFWLEDWKDGVCVRWAELSEDEFNELRCQSKK